MSSMEDHKSVSGNKSSKQEFQKFHLGREGAPVCDIWTDVLICAYQFVQGSKRITTAQPMHQCDEQDQERQAGRTILSHAPAQNLNDNTLLEFHSLIDLNSPSTVRVDDDPHTPCHKENAHYKSQIADSRWVPVGWARISGLVQIVQVDAKWSSQQIDLIGGGDEVLVKLLKRKEQDGDREFIGEVEMLSRLHHLNPVKLIGICSESHKCCLFYELVRNGRVESRLHALLELCGDAEFEGAYFSPRMDICITWSYIRPTGRGSS